MQLPIVQPAPIVTEHSPAFQELFKNRCQFQHFQNYLTGLIVLDNKTMANITRCVLNSADKTNMSRFFSEANWDVESVNKERVAYLLQKTEKHRLSARKSVLAIDDTLFEHVGSLFEYIDKHYNHGDNTYPLALVTNHLSWHAKKILQTYLLRCPIETFYQDAKQQLGLNQYRMRKAKAIEKHWCLVFVAYSFLHLDCLPLSRRQKVHKPIKTIGQIVRQQTRQVIESLLFHTHQLLDQGIDVSQVFAQLFAKQVYTMSS